ncbi:unnamed protein product [Linum tenue]|uniref:Uncharacterized protein n=1 Tax=Linum tenue TaxID=586396 RepID=A0AAV0Q5Z6_9ROSI|nr:unnamed protein product [Linum tenue]
MFLVSIGHEKEKGSIIVLLVGAPGSGKSTFIEHVMRSSSRSWARIFQFDNEKPSDIIVEKVEEFVNKTRNARLVLMDLRHKSKILSLVKGKDAQRNKDSNKFFTFVGDITKLYSQGGLRCNIIANAANWRLELGGGGGGGDVNTAIFNDVGPALEVSPRDCAKSLLPGHVVAIPLT